MKETVSAIFISTCVICCSHTTNISKPLEPQRLEAQNRHGLIDRGVIAVPIKTGQVYISWRLLADDPAAVYFDVFRSNKVAGPLVKLNATPITNSTNYIDSNAEGKTFSYVVRAIAHKNTLDESAQTAVDEATAVGGFRQIRLQSNYTAQMVGLGDFNGDGKLDYLVKHPNFNVDPFYKYWTKSPETYKLEAYRHDGQFLWRYDMGWAIETGIWYSPVLVYDIDGNGRAEIYCKAGDGDSRDSAGYVRDGPEYLVKLDGETGKILNKIPWPDRNGYGPLEGDKWYPAYNYSSRNFLGVAYLDGKRPHLIIERGTYELIKIHAYDPTLELKWSWQSSGDFSGQGSHGLQIADIDDDGRDEIVYGAAAIDDNGMQLWTTGRYHPDVCYLGDIDPTRPGLEVFYGHERPQKKNGLCLVEASTGKTIWGYDDSTTHIHDAGMVADIDPRHPGMECYAGEADGSKYWLYSAEGARLSDRSFASELDPKAVFWTEGPSKVIVAGGEMFNYNGPSIGKIEGKIVAIADCLGDWREEVITSLPGEIRIYSTATPAASRRIFLMQNRQYHTSVARQTMGYFYPPIGNFLN